jgi:hypothetical protein
MVDVVVDAKPVAKLPFDPDTIPEAVKRRAAAVDALYQGSGGEQQQEPPGTEPAFTPEAAPSQAQESPDASPTQQPPPAPAESPPPPEDENSNTWKSRALSTQGRLEAANRTLGELQEQYYQEVMRSQVRPKPHRAPQEELPQPQQFLTAEDEANYGRELLDVTQRAALQAVTPKIQEIEQQNAHLRQQVARERRRALDQAVELAVPDFREIDRNPRWHRWLLGIDVLSGRVRQQLLDEAVSAGSAPRVVSFFNSFRNEEAATGHIEPAPSQQALVVPREAAVPLASLAAPGRGRPASGGEASVPPDKPTYTRPQIRQLYEQHRRGAYVGREAEWARLDADIIAAGREGRIRT